LNSSEKLQVFTKYYFEHLVNSVLTELVDLTCSTSKFKICQAVEKVVCTPGRERAFWEAIKLK